MHGYDGMTDYYDVRLKHRRHGILLQNGNFSATEGMLENGALLDQASDAFEPDVIVHLAAQAGVRYSLENPRAYIDSNVVGTLNVMETARRLNVQHLLMASTSSVYAPTWTCRSGRPTRPIPSSRFTPRPDLALYRFVDAILDGRPIDIYNHGEMYRDFTYVGDIVRAIALLIDVAPVRPASAEDIAAGDSLSPVAPFRIVNIGNSNKVRLLDFVEAIEECVGRKAIRNYMDMQMGDVPATWADATLLQSLTGYRPQTDLKDGIRDFVTWFRDYYEK